MKSLLILLAFCVFVSAETRLDPLVYTKQGLIRGIRAEDGDYSKFLGIPYALVDEKNPFGTALTHPGFEDVYEAYDDSNFCLQTTIEGGDFIGDIQCLQLHIYVPDKANSQNRLPVIVWVHGGGFNQGIPTKEQPTTLLKNDVIVVSIAYRLGVYGFLCLDTPEVPGNQGLKDQVLAFRWIKENIEAFGGDPTKITAVGESAGARAINLHLYSEYEKLFERSIIQSGPALTSDSLLPADTLVHLKLAKQLGFLTNSTDDALAFLASTDPVLVTAAAYKTDLISVIKPCIEKKFEGVENFITQHPRNIKVAPKVKDASIIIGYTSEEYGTDYAAPPEDGNYDYFEKTLYSGFDRHEALDGAVDLIKHFYVGDEKEFGINVRQETALFRSDWTFSHPTQRMVEQFIDNGAKAVYRYVFSYTGDRNVTGASHGAELLYLFDENYFVAAPDKNDKEQLLFKQMTKLWTNFAKYGNPTPEATDLLPVVWKPATKIDQYSLDIDSELTLRSRPDHQRMTFWDLFYKTYGKYQIGYEEDN